MKVKSFSVLSTLGSCVLMSSLCITTAALAHDLADSIDAPGKVFYLKDKAIVGRDVTLEVPAQGRGQVFLKYGEGKKFAARDFRYFTREGRTVFQVLFVNPPGAPSGTALLFEGSYMRGTNLAIYYGDMFSRRMHHLNEDVSLDESATTLTPRWNHKGGFVFKAKISSNESAELELQN